jgi:methylglutaconyl-CoA hydratase
MMKHIKVEDDKNKIRTVTLNRPERRNAFHPEMIAELTQVFLDSQIPRAVILRGEGESFCAGADLEWMKSMAGFTFAENQQDSLALYDMYEAAKNLSCPLLGRIHGHAFGGAVGLVAVCDVAVAESDTRFCFSEVRLGLAPAVISPFVARKMVPSKLREWMLTAKTFSAQEALGAGLIHCEGHTEKIEGYLAHTVTKILHAGPQAVAETKRLLNFLPENPWSNYRAETAKVIAERRVSDEGQRGLKAFFDKKNPDWMS